MKVEYAGELDLTLPDAPDTWAVMQIAVDKATSLGWVTLDWAKIERDRDSDGPWQLTMAGTMRQTQLAGPTFEDAKMAELNARLDALYDQWPAAREKWRGQAK